MHRTHRFLRPPATRTGGHGPSAGLFAALGRLAAELGGVWAGPLAAGLAGDPPSAPDFRGLRRDCTVSATLLETDEQAIAHQVIAEELGREERLVLLLHYADGLSFADIAEVLDLPEPAVERLYRGTMATLEDRLR